MGIEQSLEKKEAIVKEFGWDLTGDSPDNPRSKFFFEADAEKIMIFLEKDKLVIQQLEASLKESQDKVAQWITDYDELESENHRIQSRLQEAEKEVAKSHNSLTFSANKITELEKEVERLREQRKECHKSLCRVDGIWTHKDNHEFTLLERVNMTVDKIKELESLLTRYKGALERIDKECPKDYSDSFTHGKTVGGEIARAVLEPKEGV